MFLLLPSSSVLWPFIGLLACTSNVGFGASVVAMNSYLPSLARETKEVREALQILIQSRQQNPAISEDVEEPGIQLDDILPLKSQPEEAYKTAVSRSTSQISSLGIALGYVAGIVLLIFAIIPVSLLRSSTYSLRLAIGMSGIWWAVMTVPAGFWLPTGQELMEMDGAGGVRVHDTTAWSWSKEIKGAWVRLGQMLRWREIKRLRNTFWYLSAWFVLSDGKTNMI